MPNSKAKKPRVVHLHMAVRVNGPPVRAQLPEPSPPPPGPASSVPSVISRVAEVVGKRPQGNTTPKTRANKPKKDTGKNKNKNKDKKKNKNKGRARARTQTSASTARPRTRSELP